ncbi:hypothetical protein Tco_0574406 [Tanacetum coccineum]
MVEHHKSANGFALLAMLSASKLPLSFWAEAVATACYTQNRSIIISAHGKTAYHIINDRKPSIKHLHIFGCICYITRDGENLDKMKEKGIHCAWWISTHRRDIVLQQENTLIIESNHIKQNVVPTAEKTDSSHQELEFLFSPLIEEYYTPAHGHAEDNNNGQAPNASFQEAEFINPFCTHGQRSSIRTGVGWDSWKIQPCQFKQDDSLPKILKCVCSRSRTRKDEVQTVIRTSTTCSLKVMLRRGYWILKNILQPVLAWNSSVYRCYAAHMSFPYLLDDVKTAFLNGPLKGSLFCSSQEWFVDQTSRKNLPSEESFTNLCKAVCYCARYQARPTQKHLKEVKRIFKYLKGTINMGLWYPKDSGFELTAFSDADHQRHSTWRYLQVAAEAEYVALFASCAQVMWMRTQLQDYGFNYNKISLYCDSQSAIAISCNPVQHSRTKHIHTRYHFIKEHVENGIIELYFVRTEYQLADMFMKALLEDRFKYLVRRIGMRCLSPAELEVLTNETA